LSKAEDLSGPVSGNYGGDSQANFATFNRANGFGRVRGFTTVYFGRAGEIPTSIPGKAGDIPQLYLGQSDNVPLATPE